MTAAHDASAVRLQACFRGVLARRKNPLNGYDWYDEPPFRLSTADDAAADDDADTEDSSPGLIYRSVSVDLFGDAQPTPVIQVGGHGILKKAKDTTDCLTKEVPHCEVLAYESVQGTPLEGIFAEYIKHEHFGALYTVTLRDMTAGMARPCVMDIKIGKRTFLESEVKKQELRVNLAKKMVDIDPTALTEEEQRTGITKLRYMQFREQRSSSASFGFRVEGATARGYGYPNCKDIQSGAQISNALHFFVQSRAALKTAYVQRLEEMRALLSESDWFMRHEVVGSSILFVYDDGARGDRETPITTAAARMIDFAKTEQLPDDARLTHTADWELGNREEGYLTGLDNLISLFKDLDVSDD